MTSSGQTRALKPDLLEVARSKCNEKPEEIAKNIKTLQTWIKKSTYLKARTDEQLLLSYLRAERFNVEDTKRRIDAFYSLKNCFPEVLRERSVNEKLLQLLRQGLHIIPSQTIGATGPRLIISHYSKYDHRSSTPQEMFKLLFMMLEILALEDDNASVSGVSYVIDVRDGTKEQMQQYDPYLLKKIWTLIYYCLPLRFTEIHLINARKEGQGLFNFVTKFIPISNMPIKFIVHRKSDDLFEYLPRDIMTIEYGGHNGYEKEAVEIWEKKLLQYQKYFAKDESYGTNEKLRAGIASSWRKEDLCGLSGHFRKLNVD